MGLAIDFSGRIAAHSSDSYVLPGTMSDAAKWLAARAATGHVDDNIVGTDGTNATGNGTYDIKRYRREAWHWSVDGA
jgi:hypothetical protein